jgi:hypothetical protein
VGSFVNIGPLSSQTVTTNCPAGKNILGGGFEQQSGTLVQISQSRPTDAGTGWTLFVTNTVALGVQVRAYAICALVT